MGITVRIEFKVIPHKEQRYETVGDWVDGKRVLKVRVSDLKDGRMEVLVFLHELIEAMLCKTAGVSQEEVDRWDEAYEVARAKRGRKVAPCKCAFFVEPGEDPHAPYFLQHAVATQCEKMLAKALDVDWEEYGRKVESL